MRKCRACKSRLPRIKDCETPHQRAGFCGGTCCAMHKREKRLEQKPIERKPVKRRSKRKPRAGDNRAYLDWVKALPCVLCGAPADEAHHIIGQGFGGMGMTAPDLLSMPVCREHHDLIHRSPEHWDWQCEWVVKTIARAIQEGIL